MAKKSNKKSSQSKAKAKNKDKPNNPFFIGGAVKKMREHNRRNKKADR